MPSVQFGSIYPRFTVINCQTVESITLNPSLLGCDVRGVLAVVADVAYLKDDDTQNS